MVRQEFPKTVSDGAGVTFCGRVFRTRSDMGPFLLTKSHPIYKYLVLKRTHKLCASNYSTGTAKLITHNLKETASTMLQ